MLFPQPKNKPQPKFDLLVQPPRATVMCPRNHMRGLQAMPVEENIQLMRRWFQEVWNEGRMQTVHDLLAPGVVARGQRAADAEIRGPEEFVKFVHEIRRSFSDIHLK